MPMETRPRPLTHAAARKPWPRWSATIGDSGGDGHPLCRGQLDPGDLVQDVLQRLVANVDRIPAELPVGRGWCG
jgi:hypothetical protein